jgi:hypothetical protein
MGLMVHSLDNIPEAANRGYFIYLLDYGWQEPISEALQRNFEYMAYESANNNAVIIKGTDGKHFQNEVFSWHQINGLDGEDILPALLITNSHPSYFREKNYGEGWGSGLMNKSQQENMKLIIIPFRKFCTNSTEAVDLIKKVFQDIKSQKDLSDFSIAKEIKGGSGRAIADAVVLQPNIAGVGIDLKKLIGDFLEK